MKLFFDGLVHALHPAFEQHLAGINPELGWKIRGLSGHDLQWDEYDELGRETNRGLHDLIADKQRLRPMLDRLMAHYQSLAQAKPIPDVAGLTHPQVHLVVGYMRTGGTFLFKQLMESCGLDHTQYLQKMTHDSLPSYQLCMPEFAQSMNSQLLLELAEYCLWLQDCWPKDAPLVQKRIAYGHDIPRFNRLFGGQAHWWITLRDPSWAIDSFFKMENLDANSTQSYPSIWQLSVQRYKQETLEAWKEKPYYQKALDGWCMFHLDLFDGLKQIPDDQYTLIPFERAAQTSETGPIPLDFSGFKPHNKERPDYFDAELHNRAIDRVMQAADAKFHPYLAAYKS